MVKILNPIHDRPAFRPDRTGGKRMIEIAGYIPKDIQLRLLVQSGEALEKYYKKLFPELHSTEEPVFDPTIQVGFDRLDAWDNIRFVQNNLRLSEMEAKQRAETLARAKPSPVPPGDNEGAAKADS